MSPLRLSVLDQSIAVVDRPHGNAIRDTIALAQHCEALGYDRFWVSEHHSNETIVGTAPEILIAAIASVTKRIRVGSAGVMLPHYSPFKVAEQFRVLEAIAPGRIDLGLGRAPGSDGRTAFALNPLANERPAQFPADVRDLMAWVTGSALPDGHPFAAVRAYPAGDTSPEIWMLGSSDYGAQVAAHFGLPYAFAWFFSDGAGGAAGARHLPQALQAEPAPSRAAHGAVRVGAGGGDGGGGAVPFHARAPASACCATAASSRRSSRRRRPRPTPTRMARRRASPSYRDNAFVGRPAGRCSASRSSPSGSTCRRWPSSPGPTTRPCATRATA